MIIFLYGPDTFRSRQKLKELILQYKKVRKGTLNLKFFDFAKTRALAKPKELKSFLARSNEFAREDEQSSSTDDFKIAAEEFCQPSMFAEKKLLVFKNVLACPEFRENFLKDKEALEDFWEGKNSTIIFYEEGDADKRTSLFNFLLKTAKCQQFDFLSGEKLIIWLKREFKNFGSEIEPDALNKLIEFVGQDSWQYSNEIKKLVSYKRGGVVEKKDVELLVKPKIEADIFKTIDSLAQKNKKEALMLIHRHLEKGDSAHYLLSMINFQFRNLLVIKSLSQKYQSFYPISKVSGLHPFVVKKGYALAQKFKYEELKKIYRKLFQIDADIKTGRKEPVLALDLLISTL